METTYTYDPANNRTKKSVIVDGGAAQETNYTYNILNQLATAAGPGVTATFAYNANGNRTSMTRNGVETNYIYDRLDRLSKVANPATGLSHQYKYDYRTRRVERKENVNPQGVAASSARIVFSGGTSVFELENSQVAVEHVRGNEMGGGVGGILYSVRGGTPSYAHANSRGDVVTRTGSGGNITWQGAYEAFGTRTEEFGATGERQKANSKEEDPTGLLNEGFRYRDLEFGVWLTRDPAGFVDGPNLYTYVRQNPWSMFDPKGLDDSEWHHRFPQEFEAEFREMNIDIHRPENGILLKENDHQAIHGKVPDDDAYNKRWGEFFEDLRNEGVYDRDVRRTRAEALLKQLESREDYAKVLKRGARLPANISFKEYASFTSDTKSLFYREVWSAKTANKILAFMGKAGNALQFVAQKVAVPIAVLTYAETTIIEGPNAAAMEIAVDATGASIVKIPFDAFEKGMSRVVIPASNPSHPYYDALKELRENDIIQHGGEF